MYKTLLSSTTFLLISINIYANSDISSKELSGTPSHDFLKTTNGYVRVAYENHNVENDKTYIDGALGLKLQTESTSYYGISFGSTFYVSKSLGASDNRGLVPFRGEVVNSYTILGEAYIKGVFGNTVVKFGRQEIETPFAQADDIGIVPNTFEAYILENKDIPSTTLFLGQIQKMAGVDAEVVDSFTRINNDNNIQVVGLTYEGIANLGLSAWFYHLKDAEIDNINYIEANYEDQIDTIGYAIGLQYSKQTYATQDNASIYGINISISHENTGITLGSAYNKVVGNTATSGFGGGPFFSNSEYLIIDNVGKAGSQILFGLELDASVLGIAGLSMGLSKVSLENNIGKVSTEVDFVTNYSISENLEMHLIYSDLDGTNVGEDHAKHMRAFVNYSF